MARNPFAADGAATNPNPEKIEYPACDRCGSPNVSADAAARWDHQAQDWTVTNIFDKGHSCDDCEDECKIEWKDGNPIEPGLLLTEETERSLMIQEVETALLLTSDTNANTALIESWTDEQRTLAFDWAMALHFSASDNDDVVVPPRPDFIPYKEPNDEE